MKKTLALLFFALPLCFTIEAKENTLVEGLNVIRTKENTINGQTERSQTISADITGNTLTITFNDNVGIAHIIIKDSNGVYIDRENVF
ncbi:MAG: hypothetical protein IKU01_06750 [Bacteroidales bacterium]|nr:hypothetical protein [Bacteroidales bacterium]